jgi:hypothetical protein
MQRDSDLMGTQAASQVEQTHASVDTVLVGRSARARARIGELRCRI